MALVVHPHFHRRRTGVTQHVETIVPALAPFSETRVVESRLAGLAIRPTVPRVAWREIRSRAKSGDLVWHAHRNGELAAGLLLRAFFPKTRVVFTRHAAHRPSWITRLLARRADRVVALTSEVATAMGMPSRTIGHGLDAERFQPPTDRSEAWRALGLGGAFGIGVIGRIRPAKGQGDFVEAVAPLLGSHPEWTSVLVGRAKKADQSWYERLTRAAPALRLVGEQPEIERWYRGFTILVQPSHAEGYSLVLLEALASGCCVVASRLPHFTGIIDHGRTGFLYEPGNVTELRTILVELMANPDRARKIGSAAAEDARNRFGIEREAKALSELYRELLEQR